MLSPLTASLTGPLTLTGVAPRRVGGGGPSFAQSKIGWSSIAGFVRTASSGYAGRTYQLAIPMEGPFTRVRAVLVGNEAGTWAASAIAASASSMPPDDGLPTGGAWVQLGAKTAAARIAENRPSRTATDWADVASIVAADGSGLYYLFLRVYIAAGEHTQYGESSQFNSTGEGTLAADGSAVWRDRTDARTAGRIVNISDANGDFVTSNQSGFTSPGPNFGMPAIEIEVEYASNAVTVCTIGDSITEGDTASVKVLSPLHYAIEEVSTVGKPVVASNQGWSNRDTTNFADRLGDIIASGRAPSIVVYSAWSPNNQYIIDGNGSTTGQWETAVTQMKADLASAVALCEASGIFLVICTGVPYAYDASHDDIRVAYNDYLRALTGEGIVICDYDATLSDGATPAKMQTTYTDGTSGRMHPYDAGYSKMGKDVLAPVLQTVIDAYF